MPNFVSNGKWTQVPSIPSEPKSVTAEKLQFTLSATESNIAVLHPERVVVKPVVEPKSKLKKKPVIEVKSVPKKKKSK